MSTRYVWGRYTRTSQTYPVTAYRAVETQLPSSKAFDLISDNGYKFYLGSGYRLSQYDGMFTVTGASLYTGGLGHAGEVFGTGYIPNYYQNPSPEILYGANWKQINNIGGIGFALQPSNKSITQINAQQYTDYEIEYIRGPLVGYSSSSSRSAHPDDQWDGTYWYVYSGQDSIDAAGVSIPSKITGGTNIIVTVAPGSGKIYGGNVSYSYQYKFGDNGAWNSLIITTATQYTLAIPIGTTNVQVRIQAKDDVGFTSSDYSYSETVEVVNGAPPSISSPLGDSPYNMGKITEPFTFEYTVSDTDFTDRLTVYELIISEDETYTSGLQRENVSPGGKFNFEVFSYLANQEKITEGAVFQMLPHDVNMAAEVYAVDSYENQSNTFTVTFIKTISEIDVTLKKPLAVEGSITEGVIYVIGFLPDDSDFIAEATNNANDEEPVWQDITYEVNHHVIFEFNNIEAIKGYAFNFRLHAKRGGSNEGGYIDSIMGAFR